MTDLEQQLTDHLRRRAAAAIPRYDLEGVEQATRLASLVDLDDHRPRRPTTRTIVGLVAVAAVAAAVITIAVVTIPSDESTVSTPSDGSTVSTSVLAPGGGPAFAAAIEASGLLTSPSADEVAQATDGGLYKGQSGEVSPAGNWVSLSSCKARALSTCGGGWAYATGAADGGNLHGGLLGEATPLQLYLLDDRYFVASEGRMEFETGVVLEPSKAWLIDAVSGKAGALSWRDEPTTLNSPEQALLLWGGDIPQVVDARDGTIRPLAMPDDALARPSVAQHGTGRIWVETDPDGDAHGLGLAYSDDGGATWSDVALPEAVRSTSVNPDTSDDPDLQVAADGDRVAVAAWWGHERKAVYVSNDAGRSWTTAAHPELAEGNGSSLEVLADGRLVLMWRLDASPRELLVSTGSDWAELESHFSDHAGNWKNLSVNRAGIAQVPSFVEECATLCYGGEGGFVLNTFDFSPDLTNWSTIENPTTDQ